MPRSSTPNAFVFWPVVIAVVVVDIITKAIAVATLQPRNIPHPVIGETLRWKLVYNP